MRRSEHPYLEALRNAPVFDGTSRRDLEWLAEQAVPHRLRPGSLLTLERYHGEQFLLLTDGVVSVRRGDRQVAALSAGDHLGELALLDHADRCATVVASTPVRMLAWDREVFEELLHRLPHVHARVRETAARRREAPPVASADSATAPSPA